MCRSLNALRLHSVLVIYLYFCSMIIVKIFGFKIVFLL